MTRITISDNKMREAAANGMDAFMEEIANAIKEGVGGELSAETMSKLNSEQITLLGYITLRDEVMDGGFIQMIYNGYGPFFFRNPFDAAMRNWGLVDLCRLIRRAKKNYQRYRENIEKEMTDEEFMALYESMPVFDEYDDEFVSNEEQWTNMVACYLDDHLDKFVEIIEK